MAGNARCGGPVLLLLLVLVCSPVPSDAFFGGLIKKFSEAVQTVAKAGDGVISKVGDTVKKHVNKASTIVQTGIEVVKKIKDQVEKEVNSVVNDYLGGQRRVAEKWCGRVVAVRFQETPGALGKLYSDGAKIAGGIQATLNKAQKISTTYVLPLAKLGKGDLKGVSSLLPFSAAEHLKYINPKVYLDAAEEFANKTWDYAQGHQLLEIAQKELNKVRKNVMSEVNKFGNIVCSVRDKDLTAMIADKTAAVGALTAMVEAHTIPFHTNKIGDVCSSDLFKELTSVSLGEDELNKTTADLKKLGSQVMDSVPIGRVWEFTDTQIVDVADSIRNDLISRVDHKASKTATLANKALDGGLVNVLNKGPGVASYLPPNEIRKLSATHTKNSLIEPLAGDCFHLERSAMAAMKGNFERMGEFSAARKPNGETVRNIGCAMAEMPMCKHAGWLTTDALRGAVDSIGSLVGLTAGDYQRYRQHMSDRTWARERIEFFHNGNIKMVAPRTFLGITRDQFLALFDTLLLPLDCFVEAPAHGAAFLEAIRQAFSPPHFHNGRGIAELVPKHLEVIGDALAYLTEDDANRLANESCFVDVLASLGLSKVVSPRVRVKLMNNFIEQVPEANRTEQTYINMGELTPFIPRAELNRLLGPGNTDQCKAVVEVLERMDQLHHVAGRSHISFLTNWALSCLKASSGPISEETVRYLGAMVMGLTEGDLARVEEDALDELADMVSYIQEPDEAFLGDVFHRIGAARLATPAIIDRLRDHAVLLPVTAIRTFTKKTFEQTVDEFGAHPTIHDVQAEALLAQAEKHWGANHTAWPKRNFYRLGYVLGALPEAVVDALPQEMATYVAEKMTGTEGDSKAQAKAERLVAKKKVKLPTTAEEARALGPNAVRWFDEEEKARTKKSECLVDSLVNMAKTVENTVYTPYKNYYKPKGARGMKMKAKKAAAAMETALGNAQLDEFTLAAMVPALPEASDALLAKIPGSLVNKVMDHLGERSFSEKQAKMLVNSLNNGAVRATSKAMMPSQVDRIRFAEMGTLTQAFEPATLTMEQVASWTPKVVSQLEPGYFRKLSIPQLMHLDSAQVRAVSSEQYKSLSAAQASAFLVSTSTRTAGDVPLTEQQQDLANLPDMTESSNAGLIAGVVVGVLLLVLVAGLVAYGVKTGKVPKPNVPDMPDLAFPNVSRPSWLAKPHVAFSQLPPGWMRSGSQAPPIPKTKTGPARPAPPRPAPPSHRALKSNKTVLAMV